MPGDKLTPQDRRQIATGLREGLTYAAIGRRIGRPTSTVTREVMRNGGPRDYDADQAHRASTRHVRQHRPTSPTPPLGSGDLGGPDPRIMDEVIEQSTELMIQAGLPHMMAKVLAALFSTDSGCLTSAELVRSLRVSPASISKAVGYLESQALIRRERDPRSRAERYVIDDDVLFQSIMASARNQTQIAAACRVGARKLGVTTPAGVRLENMGQFLLHVVDDLVRSVQHWRQVYSTQPPAVTNDDSTTTKPA
jgi:DNA-binding transcriptional regulator GbsR (MarR family)